MKTPKGEVDDRIVELLNHEEVLTKMSEAKSPQECYDVVKDTIDISFEEFTAFMYTGVGAGAAAAALFGAAA